MRAVFARNYGTPDDLTYGEFPKPAPGPDEVLIQVKAAGVAFHDGLQLANKHQLKHPMPYVPGMEIAGIVAALGENVDGPAPGTPVMALHWRGGWGEYAVVLAGQVWAIPSGVDYPAAAAISMAYTTAHCGLHWEGRVEPGDVVLVTGAAGGVGLAAVEVAKAMGARVIAIASSDERLAITHEHGADEGINYTETSVKEAVMELTDGKGADVALDPVMGSLYSEILSSLGWGGRHVIIGFAGGEIPQIPSNRLLVKNRRALGMVMSFYRTHNPHLMAETVETLFGWSVGGEIKPRIAETGGLEKAPAFLRSIMDRELIGRAILEL